MSYSPLRNRHYTFTTLDNNASEQSRIEKEGHRERIRTAFGQVLCSRGCEFHSSLRKRKVRLILHLQALTTISISILGKVDRNRQLPLLEGFLKDLQGGVGDHVGWYRFRDHAGTTREILFVSGFASLFCVLNFTNLARSRCNGRLALGSVLRLRRLSPTQSRTSTFRRNRARKR